MLLLCLALPAQLLSCDDSSRSASACLGQYTHGPSGVESAKNTALQPAHGAGSMQDCCVHSSPELPSAAGIYHLLIYFVLSLS